MLILYLLHKITIFGAKIQILQVKLAFKTFQNSFIFLTQKINFAILDLSENGIFGHDLKFSNSVYLRRMQGIDRLKEGRGYFRYQKIEHQIKNLSTKVLPTHAYPINFGGFRQLLDSLP